MILGRLFDDFMMIFDDFRIYHHIGRFLFKSTKISKNLQKSITIDENQQISITIKGKPTNISKSTEFITAVAARGWTR